MWSKIPKPSAASSSSKPDDAAAAAVESATVVQSVADAAGPSQPQEPDCVPAVDNAELVSATLDGPQYSTPAQKKVIEEIECINKKIADFNVVKQTVGLSFDHEKKLSKRQNWKRNLEDL